MKRTIVLIRHGKAVPVDTFKKDIDRVLAERGVYDGYKIGYKLVEEKIIPDRILTSPAARASHTALILARAMRVGSGITNVLDNLYHCTTDSIMSEIAPLPDETQTVFLVGHNPGITDMAYLLSGGATTFLPTTGTAIITFDADSWADIPQLQCLEFKMIKPKEIK
ncbi:MAG: histidine phosphatase family protein [Bacteroidales bacterium]|nr:histidine phosphatase family protein [Bacteroidales bacterium]